MQISIACPQSWCDLQNIKDELRGAIPHLNADDRISIHVHEERFLETAVLVAVITGGATVVAALIQAIAASASKREAKRIKITGRFGGDVEIPADADIETINAIAQRLGALQDPKIQIE
jgi:hypothetical protein